jgi:hypothetical protein
VADASAMRIGIDDFSPNRALLVERMEVTGG